MSRNSFFGTKFTSMYACLKGSKASTGLKQEEPQLGPAIVRKVDASESQDQKPEASKEDDKAQSEEMVVEQPLEQEAEPEEDPLIIQVYEAVCAAVQWEPPDGELPTAVEIGAAQDKDSKWRQKVLAFEKARS